MKCLWQCKARLAPFAENVCGPSPCIELYEIGAQKESASILNSDNQNSKKNHKGKKLTSAALQTLQPRHLNQFH